MRKFTLLPTAFAAVCFALAGIASPASAVSLWDVTFTRDTIRGEDGARTSNSFNLMVVLETQTNFPLTSTETKGECFIRFNDGDDSCTIHDFPTQSNALVTVYASTNPSVTARNVYGKIQFWISVFADSEVHIPTGVVNFEADKTWNQLVVDFGNCCKVAILPQSVVETGESYSDRPNSGTSYFGQTLGNCGPKDLASNTPADKDRCRIDLLAGCYSPVFARPISGDNKAKIWVNKSDSGPSDHVLCVNDDQEVDYLIKVQ